MPYNVIILSSTVIALAFGSVFNILVRRFVALEPGDVVVGNKLRGLILGIITFIKARIERAKTKSQPKSQTTTEMNGGGGVEVVVVVEGQEEGREEREGRRRIKTLE